MADKPKPAQKRVAPSPAKKGRGPLVGRKHSKRNSQGEVSNEGFPDKDSTSSYQKADFYRAGVARNGYADGLERDFTGMLSAGGHATPSEATYWARHAKGDQMGPYSTSRNENFHVARDPRIYSRGYNREDVSVVADSENRYG